MDPQQNKQQPNLSLNNESLDQKIYAARLAMETEEFRVKREAHEKEQKEKEERDQELKRKEEDSRLDEEKKLNEAKKTEELQTKLRNEMSLKMKGEVDAIKKVGGQITPLRTFKDDFDTTIKEQSVTLARMTMLEDSKKRETETEEASTSGIKKYMVIGFSVLLLLSGVGFGVYVYLNQTQPEIIKIVAKPRLLPEIVYAENRKQINITNSTSEKALNDIKTEITTSTLEFGKIENVQIVKNGADDVIEQISVSNFLNLLNSGIPGDLSRFLASGYMVGLVNPLDGNKSGLIIFKIDSYQNAFAGMLNWEKGTILRDIYGIIKGISADENLLTKKFEDYIVSNQDTRILKNDSGEIVLVYGFLNSKTLAITGNLSSFNELIARFRNSPN